jgi:phosphohistidine phosphatase
MLGGAAAPACILVRHAHAQWPAYQGRDFDRPLTERGNAEARAAGQAIRAAGFTPARIIASSARRTEQTARILLEHLQCAPTALQLLDSLYNAEASTLWGELKAFAQSDALVVLVAHNPGISELAQQLSGSQALPPFRTAEWRHFGAHR